MSQGTERAGHPSQANELAAGTGEGDIRIAMDKRIDTAVAAVVVFIGAYICYTATSFRIGNFPDPITPRGLPYFLGGFLIVVGLLLIARRIITWSALPGVLVVSEGTDDEPGHPASFIRAAAIVVLTFLWLWLLRPVGYLIISPIILAAMLWVMNVRSKAVLVLFPLGFSLFIWLIFGVIFHIHIPLGPLTALARSWGLVA
jgi:hypothetical protein